MAEAQTHEQRNAPEERGPAFEWWMLVNLGQGAALGAFVALLIPPMSRRLAMQPTRVS
jgi:hypothetical protein